MKFICAARNALPDLLNALEATEARAEAAEKAAKLYGGCTACALSDKLIKGKIGCKRKEKECVKHSMFKFDIERFKEAT